MQVNLHHKGLTAFNIERSCKYAVKTCIDVTLELLTKSVSDKMKSLIIWTEIGTSLQTAVLHNLWNILSEHEARNVADELWIYDLVQFTEITISLHNNAQCCVEVHAVISQYIMEGRNSYESFSLVTIW